MRTQPRITWANASTQSDWEATITSTTTSCLSITRRAASLHQKSTLTSSLSSTPRDLGWVDVYVRHLVSLLMIFLLSFRFFLLLFRAMIMAVSIRKYSCISWCCNCRHCTTTERGKWRWSEWGKLGAAPTSWPSAAPTGPPASRGSTSPARYSTTSSGPSSTRSTTTPPMLGSSTSTPMESSRIWSRGRQLSVRPCFPGKTNRFGFLPS